MVSNSAKFPACVVIAASTVCDLVDVGNVGDGSEMDDVDVPNGDTSPPNGGRGGGDDIVARPKVKADRFDCARCAAFILSMYASPAVSVRLVLLDPPKALVLLVLTVLRGMLLLLVVVDDCTGLVVGGPNVKIIESTGNPISEATDSFAARRFGSD